MFDYLKGYVVDKRKNSKGTYLTIEVAGCGYLLEISEKDFNITSISDSSFQKMYVVLVHREDAMTLYGFINKETRDIFQILLSVSGVGAKMAIALLNEFDACDIISLVLDGNYKELTRAKGVGPKLAQKIILELKDKLIKPDISSSVTSSVNRHSQAISDTQAVLLSLGYEENEIDGVLKTVVSTVADSADSEEVLRKALTILSM